MSYPFTRLVTSFGADISDTEWIVIVLVLVIVLIVLIIAVAKCLEIGKEESEKSLLKVCTACVFHVLVRRYVHELL